MTDVAEPLLAATAPSDRERWPDFSVQVRSSAEYLVIPLIALGSSAFLFALFLLALGKSPIEFFQLIVRGGFGTPFSIQNTLQRSSPLILTALAVAVPARIGLVMIGGEGAFVIGGFVSAVVAIPLVLGHVPPMVAWLLMAAAGALTGAIWVGIAGFLRYA